MYQSYRKVLGWEGCDLLVSIKGVRGISVLNLNYLEGAGLLLLDVTQIHAKII